MWIFYFYLKQLVSTLIVIFKALQSDNTVRILIYFNYTYKIIEKESEKISMTMDIINYEE
jgi:hypothetical protein